MKVTPTWRSRLSAPGTETEARRVERRRPARFRRFAQPGRCKAGWPSQARQNAAPANVASCPDNRHRQVHLEEGQAGSMIEDLEGERIPLIDHGSAEGEPTSNRLLLTAKAPDVGSNELTFALDSGASTVVLFRNTHTGAWVLRREDPGARQESAWGPCDRSPHAVPGGGFRWALAYGHFSQRLHQSLRRVRYLRSCP
jgi:hypothetical protein